MDKVLSLYKATLVVAVAVALGGCGQTPPPQNQAEADHSKVSLTPTASSPIAPVAAIGDSAVAVAARANPSKFPHPDAQYLGDNVVGVIVLNFHRISELPLYQMVRDAGFLNDLEGMAQKLGVRLETVERATLVIDQSHIDQFAGRAQLKVSSTGAPTEDTAEDVAPEGHVPTLILSLTTPTDRAAVTAAVLNQPQEEEYENQTIVHGENKALCFVSDTMLLCGTPDAVKRLIDNKRSGHPSQSKALESLNAQADVAIAFDLESQASLTEQLGKGNPVLGLVQQVKTVALNVTVTGKPGDRLLELLAATTNEQTANTLAILGSGAIAQARTELERTPIPETPGDEKESAEIVRRAVQSATVKQYGERIEFVVLTPEGFDRLAELARPAIKKAATIAEETRLANHLKQIGIGFYNYETTHASFPGAARSADGKTGLSWRVYLLPFIGEEKLFAEFNLDEPWDSETNLKLVEKMPDTYKDGRIKEAGRTAMHVFTRAGAPFADDQAPTIRSFADGLSNTLLVVNAGPEKAEIWTKPGGLDFDPEDPIKSLGDIGDTFYVLLGDATARPLPATISAQTLRRLIESQDGQPVELPEVNARESQEQK